MWDKSKKIICTKFGFLIGDFPQIPIRSFGDFENPLGQHAVPLGLRSGLGSALRASLRPPLRPSGTACCPRGFSKSPPGSGGSGWKSPHKKPNFLYKFPLPGKNLKMPEGNFQITEDTFKFTRGKGIYYANSWQKTELSANIFTTPLCMCMVRFLCLYVSMKKVYTF